MYKEIPFFHFAEFEIELHVFVLSSTSFLEREGFSGFGMWRVQVVQSEQHMICRLMESGGQGGPSKHGRN